MIGNNFGNEQYFNPRQIGGLVLWLEGCDPAANGITPSNGTSLSSWTDKSVKGNNASQGTGANQPTFNTAQFGNKGGVTFSSAVKGMSFGISGFPSGSAARTIFIVCNSSSILNSNYLFNYGTFNATELFAIGTNGGLTPKIILDIGGTQATGNTTLLDSTNYIFECNYNGGNISTANIVVNGTTQTLTGGATTANTGTTTGTIGSLFGTGFGWIGVVASVLVYDTSLSSTKQSLVRRGLANYWGISI